MTNSNHVVRSPLCPNSGGGRCGSCAWGFHTPTGSGSGEKVADASLLVRLEGVSGYRSDCGEVKLFRDGDGRIGAVRENQFFAGIEGNPAFERFKRQLAEVTKAD